MHTLAPPPPSSEELPPSPPELPSVKPPTAALMVSPSPTSLAPAAEPESSTSSSPYFRAMERSTADEEVCCPCPERAEMAITASRSGWRHAPSSAV